MALAASVADPYKKQELIRLSIQACLIVQDAVRNLADGLNSGLSIALLTVIDCEKELDRIDQYIDEHIGHAILHASSKDIRELLACLKFTIDLERIGDLLGAAAVRVRSLTSPLNKGDVSELVQMLLVLDKMLETIYRAYCSRSLEAALSVLRMDAEIDGMRNAIFVRHLEENTKDNSYKVNLLMMTQCLERAGDHAKNLAEEVCHLVEGHSVRHTSAEDIDEDEFIPSVPLEVSSRKKARSSVARRRTR